MGLQVSMPSPVWHGAASNTLLVTLGGFAVVDEYCTDVCDVLFFVCDRIVLNMCVCPPFGDIACI